MVKMFHILNLILQVFNQIVVKYNIFYINNRILLILVIFRGNNHQKVLHNQIIQINTN